VRFLPHINPFPVISSLVSNFAAKFIDRLRHFAAYNIMHFIKISPCIFFLYFEISSDTSCNSGI